MPDAFRAPTSDDGGTATIDRDELRMLEQLDAEDRARVLVAFLGAGSDAASLRYVSRSPDGLAPAYVFDEETGMVYILD